ncbi:helix-turn-helix domain-containing protein [Phaeobacter sp. B1627]|uniref:helix-turn-helix domain-containing protein n=1 Tax=Phaeobacter sp. B1627 TaxID=2583809 RepID=UPI0011189766|nr:AraC family transcriptional regulator [Phaeobacter sp. B1627]TNJ38630.1 helix-turn-helix transcriptional regulator [Phaeobacter sp. B1627]
MGWAEEQRRFETRVARRSTAQSHVMTDAKGQLILAKATLEASAQEFEQTPYLVISHVIDGGGSFYRSSELGKIDGVMRSGTTALALPHMQAEGRAPGATLLGLVISQARAEQELADVGGLESLHAACSQLLDDPLMTHVFRSMWDDAQHHGLSSAYFDHAVGLVLHRMTRVRHPLNAKRSVQPLSPRQLARVVEHIEEHLSEDLSVAHLASDLQRDVRGFSRAFRASTGKAPYEYLVYRRMEKAKELLLGDDTIIQIAGCLNYANASKFSASFKKKTGLSPSEWRRQHA